MLKLLKKFSSLLIFLAISILQISPYAESIGNRLPILMYHHFDEDVANDMTVSPAVFEEHMRALSEAGYTAIDFYELCDYVENGTPLPENPICITMDDGYLSNYEIAYPILQKYDMKATVFAIGSMLGLSNYPLTGYPITPYFTWEQAKDMQSSGAVDIQCHTYDMHHYAPYEDGAREVRENILPLDGESDRDYERFLASDISRFVAMSEKKLGKAPFALAYPNGECNAESEKILHSLTFKVTLTTNPHSNIIRVGDECSLHRLGRYTVTNGISANELLEMLK